MIAYENRSIVTATGLMVGSYAVDCAEIKGTGKYLNKSGDLQ